MAATTPASSTLQSIVYTRGSLQVLDQLKLPLTTEYVRIATIQDAWRAIREMQVRGAPMIAMVAALGLAVELDAMTPLPASKLEIKSFVLKSLEYLKSSRPTAVNLFEMVGRLSALVEQLCSEDDKSSSVAEVKERVIEFAENMMVADVSDNKAIGDFGAADIVKGLKEGEKVCVCLA